MSGSVTPSALLPRRVAVAFLAPSTLVCLAALFLLPGYVRDGPWHTLFSALTGALALAIPLVCWAPRPPAWVLVAGLILSNAVIFGLELAGTPMASSAGFVLFALPSTFAALFFGRRVFLACQAPAAVAGVIGSFVLYGDRGAPLLIHSAVALSALLGPAIALMVARERLDAALRRERDLAGTDPLTGLANRRGLAGRAELVAAHSQRLDVELCVITLDLDHFKRVNDARGHRVGDEVLCRVSRSLIASTRALDVVARLGGEEFAVLAALGQDDGLALAERLREQVALDCADVGVTASLGLAWTAAPGRDKDVEHLLWGLVDRADDFMYVAKRMGRNRVVAAPTVSSSGPFSTAGWPAGRR